VLEATTTFAPGTSSPERASPPREKGSELPQLVRRQHREAGERCTLMTVERWRNPPDAAFAFSQFGDLFFGILEKSVWRVGDDGMERVRCLAFQPVETVGIEQFRRSSYVPAGKRIGRRKLLSGGEGGLGTRCARIVSRDSRTNSLGELSRRYDRTEDVGTFPNR
jgi:hypothetical protein